jgi:hypothetical protein
MMMGMCDCNDDELAFVVDATGDDRDAEIGSDRSTDDAGDADAISGESVLLRFFDVGTEVGVGAGAGVGVGWGEAIAETAGGERLGRLSSLSKDM